MWIDPNPTHFNRFYGLCEIRRATLTLLVLYVGQIYLLDSQPTHIKMRVGLYRSNAGQI